MVERFSAAWAEGAASDSEVDARPLDPYLRMHTVRVFVRDLDRSLRFYLEKLGFRLAFDTRLERGQRWVAVAPPDGTAVLSLVVPGPKSPERKLIGRATQVVFVTEDVLGKFREWHKRGVRFRHAPRLRRIKFEDQAQAAIEPTSRPPQEQAPAWGGVFTRFEDVDGNSFALVSFDEESRAVEAQRRAAALRLESDRHAAHELEIATQVQARLFSQRQPSSRTLEYAGLCIQVRRVGGDYYDFLDLGRERLGLVVGDIAGKGMAAALLMANLQANLRSQCATALDAPERFLRSVNQLFYENTIESAYATLFFAEYHEEEQRLRYANCGHLCGLLLRRDGSLERLESTATVLGLFEKWECSIGERHLRSGDVFVLYTDGITEALDAAGDEFGEQRLLGALHRSRDWPVEAMVSGVVEDVRRFSPHERFDEGGRNVQRRSNLAASASSR